MSTHRYSKGVYILEPSGNKIKWTAATGSNKSSIHIADNMQEAHSAAMRWIRGKE